jgi:saccharopine dehydrogenase-like NADP-dependent oxidoreductase
MKALLHDLRLRERRDLLKDILENAVPATMQDVVVIFVTVSGWREGRLMQETYARKIYAQVLAGKLRSGIQVTTAASACSMLDLLAQGRLPQRVARRFPGQPFRQRLRAGQSGARGVGRRRGKASHTRARAAPSRRRPWRPDTLAPIAGP